MMTLRVSAVFLQAYGYGLDMLLLQADSLHTNYITALTFVLSHTVFLRKRLFFDTLEQILYGTCNSTSNVINYVCHSLCNDLLLIFLAVGSRKFIIIKRSFSFKSYSFKLF